MKAVSEVWQLLNIVRDAEGVTDDSNCYSPNRGVKGIREVSQLTERCDGYEGGVRRCGEVSGSQEV